MVPDTQETLAVPQNADAIAESLEAFVAALIAAKKSGASGAAFIAAAGAAIVQLEPCITAISGVGAEVAAEPLGVAEAFAIAGFKLGRAVTGK
jgi:hypothetical protein